MAHQIITDASVGQVQELQSVAMLQRLKLVFSDRVHLLLLSPEIQLLKVLQMF